MVDAGAPPSPVLAALDAVGCAARIELPADGRWIPGPPLGFSWHRSAPGDLACIGFTSGTTGQPKAIEGMHRSLAHFVPVLAETFDLRPDDRYSLVSGLSFRSTAARVAAPDHHRRDDLYTARRADPPAGGPRALFSPTTKLRSRA